MMTVVVFVVATSGLAALFLFFPLGRYSPAARRVRQVHRRVRSRLHRWHITR